MDKPNLTGLHVGGHVIFVDPVGVPHDALVTAVWGDPAECVPCINIVLVHDDAAMHDSYGRQIARHTSLCHRSVNPAHGMYYMMFGDTQNPIKHAHES